MNRKMTVSKEELKTLDPTIRDIVLKALMSSKGNQKKIDSKILNLFSKGSKENKEQLKKAFHSVTYRDQTFNRIAKYYIVEK